MANSLWEALVGSKSEATQNAAWNRNQQVIGDLLGSMIVNKMMGLEPSTSTHRYEEIWGKTPYTPVNRDLQAYLHPGVYIGYNEMPPVPENTPPTVPTTEPLPPTTEPLPPTWIPTTPSPIPPPTTTPTTPTPSTSTRAGSGGGRAGVPGTSPSVAALEAAPVDGSVLAGQLAMGGVQGTIIFAYGIQEAQRLGYPDLMTYSKALQAVGGDPTKVPFYNTAPWTPAGTTVVSGNPPSSGGGGGLGQTLGTVGNTMKDIVTLGGIFDSGGQVKAKSPAGHVLAVLQSGEVVIPKNKVAQIPRRLLTSLPKNNSGVFDTGGSAVAYADPGAWSALGLDTYPGMPDYLSQYRLSGAETTGLDTLTKAAKGIDTGDYFNNYIAPYVTNKYGQMGLARSTDVAGELGRQYRAFGVENLTRQQSAAEKAMEYGGRPRDVATEQQQTAFTEWLRTQPENSPYVNIILSYLGLQPLNTVVTPGSEGALGDIFQMLGMIAGKK